MPNTWDHFFSIPIPIPKMSSFQYQYPNKWYFQYQYRANTSIPDCWCLVRRCRYWLFTQHLLIAFCFKLAMAQCCAKLVGFEANIGFDIEISRKYRYWIGIGYEIARVWTSILILFPNCKLIDIGFDIGFELLHVGILHQFRANL